MGLLIGAPPYYGQLFFQHADGQGVSEVYWVQGANYDAALTNLKGIGNLRIAMFPPSCRLIYARVSDSTKKRDTQVFEWTPASGAGTYGGEDPKEVLPQDDALMMRMEGVRDTIPYFALKYLHLIPEDCSQDGAYDPTVEFLTALSAWRIDVVAKCKFVTKQGGTPPVALTITNLIEQRITERKAGRPFGLSVGRSRRP